MGKMEERTQSEVYNSAGKSRTMCWSDGGRDHLQGRSAEVFRETKRLFIFLLFKRSWRDGGGTQSGEKGIFNPRPIKKDTPTIS